MRRRLATLAFVMAILGPGSLVVTAQPVFADACNTPVASIQGNGAYSLTSTGSIYCGWSGVASMYVDVILQRCTVDILGCRSWENYADWGWEGQQGYGQLTKTHTSYNVIGSTRYRTYAVFHIYQTDGAVLFNWGALSQEYWVS